MQLLLNSNNMPIKIRMPHSGELIKVLRVPISAITWSKTDYQAFYIVGVHDLGITTVTGPCVPEIVHNCSWSSQSSPPSDLNQSYFFKGDQHLSDWFI